LTATQSEFRRYRRFEVAEFDCPQHVFPKHSHDEFVISANIRGRENVTLDRKSHDVTTGQLTLYNPGQVQSSEAASQEWAFASIYIAPSDFSFLTGVDQNIVFDDQFPQSPALANDLIHFVKSAMMAEQTEAEIELGLAEFLLQLTELSGSTPSPTEPLRPHQVHSIATRLLDEISSPPSLDELALEHQTTPVNIVRAFTASFGVPPFVWLNMRRITEARHRLRRKQTLADVAYDLGYADQAHFTRRFKAATGMTPAQFARMK
jgi:AraC family transcriptional regulator, chemosensory pili system protein ChpD